MLKFIKILTQDPILILTTIVLVAAVVILAWALVEYFGFAKRNTAPLNGRNHRIPPSHGDISEKELGAAQETDAYVLFEARMKEVSSQLSEIGKRLMNVEKQLILKHTSDQTQSLQTTASSSTAELEKFIQRVEKRLELMSSDKNPAPGDQLSKLEAKIEGIHKLLIILTDSGASEQK